MTDYTRLASWMNRWSAAAVAVALGYLVAPIAFGDTDTYLNACGLPAQPKACNRRSDCTPYEIDIPDYWHGLASCLRAVRDTWASQGADAEVRVTREGRRETISDFARQVVVASVRRSEVRFAAVTEGRSALYRFADVFDSDLTPRGRFDDVFVANDRGTPYNGMGQSDMAYWSLQLAAQAGKGGYERSATDAAFYRAIATGAISAALRPVQEGGLASDLPCSDNPQKRCAWYHSITRRDRRPEQGLTLNQHLHVVRDLGLIADAFGRLGWDGADRYDAAAEAGVNQLLQPRRVAGTPPVLADFLAPPAGRERVRWLYYGHGGSSGYFLNRNGSDCNYHVHVLQLLEQVLARQAKRPGDGTAAGLACGSPLAEALRTARVRFEAEDPGAWSPSEGGMELSCKPQVADRYAAISRRPLLAPLGSCQSPR